MMISLENGTVRRQILWRHVWKTNMTMEKQPFEDVSPIRNGDFSASHVIFRGEVEKKKHV